MAHQRAELAQLLLLVLRDYQKRVSKALAEAGIEGIRSKHSAVLMHIGGYGPSRMVDLADAAGIKPQSMLKIINELEAIGMVERCADPSDSRAKLIRFTNKGEATIQAFGTITESIWEQYASLIGEDSMQQSMDSLDLLVQAVYCNNGGGKQV